MNKIKFYFILSMLSLALFSCSKDKEAELAPPREYSVQYATDIKDIEEYLKTYYIEEVTTDFDIKISKIPTGGTQKSVWEQTTYPLKFREVDLHGVKYKLYYLALNQGVGESPCNVDAVFAAYKGDYLQQVTKDGVTTLTVTEFERLSNPQQFFQLTGVIKGWSEIFPLFKKGTYVSNSDGTISYKNFGAGVVFIPSGLAYYNSGKGTIPSYSPLVFNFKLYEIQRNDQDGDGIASYLEDLDGDGYMYSFTNTTLYPTKPTVNPDDTDGDGVPDFIDVDDDGDNYTTKLERSYKDANGVIKYYDFANIPLCSGGNGKKRHLDPKCHD
ncbi:FKBP-type peptidylprolyl isomerase [Flavobacterium sp.]|uniref:FKBP-type peptidyl-prolyl cis-trans isomerase n=1 Tax=Flavobacterium sp. TaxID=239 RepID=UPI0022C21697|nr:FKBP-type peptidylprolyl isomerase [Flavobacterium sp.]MCZ8228293.1 FKBP-type peptidylprolyl isomerase [Flavobacterium sp.]